MSSSRYNDAALIVNTSEKRMHREKKRKERTTCTSKKRIDQKLKAEQMNKSEISK